MQKEVIKCHKGWEKLYNPILSRILTLDRTKRNAEEKIGIRGVVNEYGMLKIILGNKKNAPPSLNTTIIGAEVDSLKLCEYCGTSENVGNTFSKVITTCCEKCFDENIKKQYPAEKWFKK